MGQVKPARALAHKRMKEGRRAGKHGSAKRQATGANRPVHVRVVPEVGYKDVAFASYACDTTGSITLLNTVAQGAGNVQRLKKRIALKSLQCRGSFSGNSATINSNACIMIVYDKRPQGVTATINEILDSVSANSFNKDTNSGRFRILKRVTVNILGGTASQSTITSRTTHMAEFYLNLKGYPTVYKEAATGAIADIEEGALYLVTVGDTAAGSTAAGIGAGFRLRYDDV